MPRTTNRTTTQTIRINGARVRLVTKNGKVTATPALPLESDCQAAQVRALKAMPEYGRQFLLAGDQNAAKRGPRAQAIALATGMAAGDPDLRIYMAGGWLRLIENKVGRGRLSHAQVERHAALARLGHTVTVVRATSPDDAAAQAVALVRGWLAANDGENKLQKSA
ncbi:VRR-NUC domain-containing protein [Pseudaminobacter arsenicus]|uniref:VRR-NUC domain-containing protein n=1 Tax=Borborobacter arsenicus TaxID=1851146 RepID=A0A432VA89_9HYPH|nr:VRR-NUC domain-containing protein [Pseudaminobacter arsenicus]RUM99015.1 VRR-NUC domain-containing protein [Pseudaminobacter arsenicus]